MNAAGIISRLERFPRVVTSLTHGLDLADARWKPAPEHWSILEICAHLADEETEDFRARVRSTLLDPSAAWPALNLDGIADRRGYNGYDLGQTVDRFARDREASVRWLRSPEMAGADWARAYHHPRFGPIPAGDLLASWAAHDALHLRQIAKRLHGLAGRDAPEFSTRYAGEWTA